ncbi:MAG: hypothetical protein AAF683_01565 [Pseudomonadota bacterium]
MFSITKLAVFVIALCLGGSASAQVQASGLDDVSPWAVDFLSEDAERLPPTLWTATSPGTLVALMRRTRTKNLTPGEHLLLRQMVFSAGDQPTGEMSSDLIAERVRILLELGEADAAATLLPLLTGTINGENPQELATDLLVGLGNQDSACAASDSQAREGAFWAKLRATCFVLNDNAPGAELALELAISEGVDDPWFYEAVFAGLGLAPETPTARYDSGISLALSKKAGLPVPSDAIASSRADLASAVALSDDLEPTVRVQAAGMSAEMGMIDSVEHRAAYEALLAEEGFTPRTALEIAIGANWMGEETIDTRARTLNAALNTAQGNVARYHAVSRLLSDDITALPKNETTLRYGLAFSRAAIAAGDLTAASDWIETYSEAANDADPSFDVAWTKGLILLASNSVTPAPNDRFGTRLVETADTPDKRQAMRRMLVLLTAFELPIGDTARAALTSDPSEDGEPVFPMLLRSITAAGNEGAAAELSLQTLKLTAGDPANVRSSDMAQIIEALRLSGAMEAARQLALESTGFWKREL